MEEGECGIFPYGGTCRGVDEVPGNPYFGIWYVERRVKRL